MGAWIALNQFKYFKSQIKGFIGIGSAPEFLTKLMWNKFSSNTKRELYKKGKILVKNGGYEYPITSQLIKDGRNKNVSKMLNKTIDGIVGVNRETEKVVDQVKKQIPSKICNAQFIANLDTLLEDCGQEELINVYNAIVRVLMSKKQFYSPTLEQKMTSLPILDYQDSKQKEPDLNVKNLDITQENKDLINKLQRQIQKKLQVKKKIGKAKKSKKKKKKKSSTNNQNLLESSA